MRDRIPDPCDEATFHASKLDWSWIENAPIGEEFRKLTRELIQIRQQKVVPLLKQGFVKAEAELFGERKAKSAVNVRWHTGAGDQLQIVTSFGEARLPMPPVNGKGIWDSDGGHRMPGLRPHQLVVALGRSPAGPT